MKCALTDENLTASALFDFNKEAVDEISFYVAGEKYVVSYESESKISEIVATDGFGGYFMLNDKNGNLIAYVVVEAE